jgi:hypothetical protein
VFPKESGLEHIFFIQMKRPFKEKDKYLAHPNGVGGISLVVIQGGSRVGQLLKAMGARAKGEITLSSGRSGRCWQLPGGAIVVIPKPQAHQRARIVGIGFDKELANDALKRINEFGVIFSNPSGAQCN